MNPLTLKCALMALSSFVILSGPVNQLSERDLSKQLTFSVYLPTSSNWKFDSSELTTIPKGASKDITKAWPAVVIRGRWKGHNVEIVEMPIYSPVNYISNHFIKVNEMDWDMDTDIIVKSTGIDIIVHRGQKNSASSNDAMQTLADAIKNGRRIGSAPKKIG